MDIYNQILQLIEKECCLPDSGRAIPEDKICLLKEAAAILEQYWKDWDFENIELMVARGGGTLYITLTSADIVVENGRKNYLFQLATLTDGIKFSQKENDFVSMELQFKNIVQ